MTLNFIWVIKLNIKFYFNLYNVNCYAILNLRKINIIKLLNYLKFIIFII